MGVGSQRGGGERVDRMWYREGVLAKSLTQCEVRARAMGAGASLDTAPGVEVGESLMMPRSPEQGIPGNSGGASSARLNGHQCAET